MTEVKVIDSMMGVGKTEYMISKINEDESNFIYITPYLDECDRIKHSCNKHFITPDEAKMGNKSRHFKHLVSKSSNIVSTHSLFKRMDDELIELLYAKDYTLVLDEVLDVVEIMNISKKDLNEILERYAHIDKDTKELIWDDEEYVGNHIMVKNMAERNSLIVINDRVILWKFPVEIFKAFKEVYILTYMFDSQIQKYYYDYYNISFKKYSVDRDLNNKSILVEYGKSKFEEIRKNEIIKKLNIYEGKLNNIGDIKYSISKNWFNKNLGEHGNVGILIKTLQKNIYTYFFNNVKTKSKFNGWTTFKDYKQYLSGKGYTRGFISINMRSSNDYKDKKSMAYIGNRYMKPDIKKMFNFKNVEIDEDGWALSEMLQWIWRGCIRNNEEMNLYIPSFRMRNLLKKWLQKN